MQSKIFELTTLQDLINVSEDTQRSWSIFRANILEKAVAEINEKSDIAVSFEPIKNRPLNGRLQVTQIKFIMQPQPNSRLTELGLINRPKEIPIEEQILYNKKKAIALIRLDQSKQFQQINNEEAWLKKTIASITDEFIETQDLIDEAKPIIDSVDINEYSVELQEKYGDYVGLKDYKLYYVFDETKPNITNTAKETFDVLLSLDAQSD